MIKSNIGRKDKIVRFILGGAIIIAGIIIRNILGLLGLLPVIIALSGWCPLYWMLRIKQLNNDVTK